jgi:hypothetical protein
MNHTTRIINAIEELTASFISAGLQPPRSIQLDSKDDAMRLSSEFLRQDFFRYTDAKRPKEGLGEIMIMGVRFVI